MNKYFMSVMVLLCMQGNYIIAQTCTKWGPYVRTPNFKDKGVLMMADVSMPTNGLAPYTYACSIQFSIGKSGGYCGIQLAGEDEPGRKPNNIFSIWDFPNKKQLIATYKAPITFVGGFGGEGTGLHSHADIGWIPGQWYTNIVRCWNTDDSTTNVGYWIYDQTNKTYTHYVTFVVPEANALLHGSIGSFLENFADDKKRTRQGEYKNYWFLNIDDNWEHPDSLIAAAGEGSWKADAFGKDGVRLTSCGYEPGIPRYVFPVQMSNMPSILSKPVVYNLGSYYDKGNHFVYVNWSVESTSSPQLGYAIALYDNVECTGKPLATLSGTNPDITSVAIPTQDIQLKKQSYYVTFELKDIFNQRSEKKVSELHELLP